jgi:hypothetical protein
MRKTRNIFLIALMLLIFAACSDNENDDPEPAPPADNYTVTYSFSVFGGYDDLQLSYFAPEEIRRIKSNPKTPWSESLSNYRKLDSVALNVTLFPIANRTITYEWEVRITQGGNSIDLNGSSETETFGDNPQPIYINWNQVIE